MNLPNFCKNSAVLVVVLYTELLVTAVYFFTGETHTIERFGYMSVYAQWLSLMCISLLCINRIWLNSLNNKIRTLFIWGFYSLSFVIVEFSFKYLSEAYVQSYQPSIDSFTRYIAISIVFLLILRVIGLLNTIEKRSKSEANSRISALQARINPHFLFNSLNVIAELTRIDAKHAEQAINSLAKLFRAALSTDSKQHPLTAELNLCYQYENIELWRLGDRLKVEWFVEISDKNQIVVPKLFLQPLLENSITHGVEEDGTINIKIDVRETKSHISVMITNGVSKLQPRHSGNGLAIENTKERLFVLYDDNHKFKIKQNINTFTVYIQIPKSLNNKKK